MPMGKGTYGSKRGRPAKKKNKEIANNKINNISGLLDIGATTEKLTGHEKLFYEDH